MTARARLPRWLVEAVMQQAVLHRSLSTPRTSEGRWALLLTTAAVALGVVGEAVRGSIAGPFFPVAVALGLAGGVAAVFALRRGERSLLAAPALLPTLVVLAFLVAEAIGGS